MENAQATPLEKHISSLTETAEKVFAQELSAPVDLFNKLPLIKWSITEEAPGALCLYLLCVSDPSKKSSPFFEEIISNSLQTKEKLKILSSRNITLTFPTISRPLFFMEVLIHIPDAKVLLMAKQELPEIAEEIKLRLLSSKQIKHILEKKQLALAGKNSFIYETIVNLIRRYPKLFSYDIFQDIQDFLVHCKEEFRAERSPKQLCKLICTHYLFQKSLEEGIKLHPNRRHLFVRLMQRMSIHSAKVKKILGISIGINSLKDYECFELRHVLAAIQRILPDVQTNKNSHYHRKKEEKAYSLIYLEIEKTSGEKFTCSEIKKLKAALPNELKNNVEYLSPSLFIPKSDEELIRHIVCLSTELRSLKDLPQVIISFREQRYDVLKFNIILLRVLTEKQTSLLELSKELSPHVRFIPERVANVGLIGNKTVKEANVFSLEVENHLFLRKHHSVDLVKARLFVVEQLEKMIGNFRDFNGTSLIKQSEQLEEIKEELNVKGTQFEFLLENLFNSLSQSSQNNQLPKQEEKELSILFLKCLKVEDFKPKECHLELVESSNSVIFVIKTAFPDIKEKLNEALKNKELTVTSATVEVDLHYYVCYLLYPLKPDMVDIMAKWIRETVKKWCDKRENLQTLRLHLQRAAQSLDPILSCDRTSGMVIKMLYEGLMRTNEKGEVENAIAQDVSISDNWKKYIFKLKKTYWSNGTPLTAHDFEYTWKKALEPDYRHPYSFLFFAIKNAEASKRGELSIKDIGVKALDDLTLSVELEHPAKYFLGLTASWAFSPLCRSSDQKHPGWAYQSGNSHVCNGAFKLDFWKLNDDLQVVRNPYYWDAKNVFIDQIQLTIVENERKSLKMFLDGEVDWIGDPLNKLPFPEGREFSQKGVVHSASAHYGLFWLQLNIKKTPLQNIKIRKALAYAINRKTLIEKIMYPGDLEAFGFFHPPHLSNHPFPNGDVEHAKKLFEEGLSELRLKKEDLPPLEMMHSEIEEQQQLTLEIGKMWKEAFGIEIKFKKLLWNAYFENLHSEKFMVGGIAWYPRFEDPMYYFNLFIFREESVHVTNWKKAEYNRLVEKARASVEDKKRIQYLMECEKLMLDEMPIIPLFYQKFYYMKNPKLKGYILSNTNQIDFRNAYFEN